jgi:hypothetical protein
MRKVLLSLALCCVVSAGCAARPAAAAMWISSSRFQPAQLNGQAVDGVFETRVQARTEVRRTRG